MVAGVLTRNDSPLTGEMVSCNTTRMLNSLLFPGNQGMVVSMDKYTSTPPLSSVLHTCALMYSLFAKEMRKQKLAPPPQQ